jgi:hypothetical protein
VFTPEDPGVPVARAREADQVGQRLRSFRAERAFAGHNPDRTVAKPKASVAHRSKVFRTCFFRGEPLDWQYPEQAISQTDSSCDVFVACA